MLNLTLGAPDFGSIRLKVLDFRSLEHHSFSYFIPRTHLPVSFYTNHIGNKLLSYYPNLLLFLFSLFFLSSFSLFLSRVRAMPPDPGSFSLAFSSRKKKKKPASRVFSNPGSGPDSSPHSSPGHFQSKLTVQAYSARLISTGMASESTTITVYLCSVLTSVHRSCNKILLVDATHSIGSRLFPPPLFNNNSDNITSPHRRHR